jgi:integrase
MSAALALVPQPQPQPQDESVAEMCSRTRAMDPSLTAAESKALAHVSDFAHISLRFSRRDALARLVDPIEQVMRTGWARNHTIGARNILLAETHDRQSAYWSWGPEAWLALASCERSANQTCRFQLIALGYLFGGHRRLHHAAGATRLNHLADMVFGIGEARAAVKEVRETLDSWDTSPHAMATIDNAILDVLLSSGSPHLKDITDDVLRQVVADNRTEGKTRRHGVFKLSRVLADQGIIPAPLTSNHHNHGPRPTTLASVPEGWLEWAERWKRLAVQEPATVRVMFSIILIAGRWAADKHPEATTPDLWTRDMAAEYVADTMTATVGSWAGHNHNRSRFGQEMGASGKANRIDALRGFFSDLVEWEWITPRFDPRRVLSLPLSVRAGIGPNPRIIDDVAWAKLMAAGLTLNSEDLAAYGTPATRRLGAVGPYYPIEILRALVVVWLFGGCRIDEIRRLEPDCIIWDEGQDEHTGESFQICLLRVPPNKTSGAFNKPVDPIVGQLVEAWKLVRPPQPALIDRKTRQPKQHLFCVRGQLFGKEYLNAVIIPALCRKAGIPESDSRGALTSHRARSTIATQLLNAREPLTLADLQQWLGHKHAASTRHYAAILQRTLSAAYKKADYFARNVRTIQVLIDRESILSGAAANGEPWKYYDLGEGYCTYDFFAKCPHRLACARCPFYLPKSTSAGQVLSVKDGIDRMLETVDLTDEERDALEGDRDALTALAERLATIPTPAGPTPSELGTDGAFIPLTTLTGSITPPARRTPTEEAP